jgi:hypothetical protein
MEEDTVKQSPEWVEARKRVTDRRDFGSHLVVYLVFNSFLVLIWAITGGGYFWPIWLIAPWGVGIVMHGWEAYIRRPVTDADIEAELRRTHHSAA